MAQFLRLTVSAEEKLIAETPSVAAEHFLDVHTEVILRGTHLLGAMKSGACL